MASRNGRSIRADANRNRDAIIGAAVTTLSATPLASTDAIAAAAGLSRATLYSHFGNRRALVLAAVRWILSRADELTEVDLERPVRESLDELVTTSWWVLGHLPGMVGAARSEISASELRTLSDEPISRIRGLLIRGRDDGVFRTDQDVGWQAECFYAILQAGAAQIREGRLSQPEAAAEMVITIREVLAAEPESSAGGSPARPAR